MIHLEKWNPGHAISAVYYDGQKELHFVKRFECEINNKKRVVFISESEGSTLDVVSTAFKPEVKIVYNKHLKATKNLPDTILDLSSFIDVKGMKAQGNQLTKLKVKEVLLNHPIGASTEPWPSADPSPALKDSELNVVQASLPNEKEDTHDVVKNTKTSEQQDIDPKTKSSSKVKSSNSKPKEKVPTDVKASNVDKTKKVQKDDEVPKTMEWDLSDEDSDEASDENDQMTLF